MEIAKKIIACIFITLLLITLTGCWNYREIESLAIVSAVAIDEGENGDLHVTVETVSLEVNQGSIKNIPEYTEYNGDSFFEAVRGMITIKGKRLYWSHAKAVLISEDIAKKDISRVLDFMLRDAEIREDMWVIIARDKKAGEVLKSGTDTEEIIGFKINDILKAQKSVSKFFSVPLFDFLDFLSDPKTSVVVPTIRLIERDKKAVSQVIETAVFNKNKLAGYLDENDSRSLLIIRNKMKKGLYVINNVTKQGINVALEIFESKTKTKPYLQDDMIVIAVSVFIEANIGEITGSLDLINDGGRIELKEIAEQRVKQDLEKLIEKAQKEYKLDFLNYKNIIRKTEPGIWRQIEADWDDVFTEIKTEINISVKIRGSATSRKPIIIGD